MGRALTAEKNAPLHNDPLASLSQPALKNSGPPQGAARTEELISPEGFSSAFEDTQKRLGEAIQQLLKNPEANQEQLQSLQKLAASLEELKPYAVSLRGESLGDGVSTISPRAEALQQALERKDFTLGVQAYASAARGLQAIDDSLQAAQSGNTRGSLEFAKQAQSLLSQNQNLLTQIAAQEEHATRVAITTNALSTSQFAPFGGANMATPENLASNEAPYNQFSVNIFDGSTQNALLSSARENLQALPQGNDTVRALTGEVKKLDTYFATVSAEQRAAFVASLQSAAPTQAALQFYAASLQSLEISNYATASREALANQQNIGEAIAAKMGAPRLETLMRAAKEPLFEQAAANAAARAQDLMVTRNQLQSSSLSEKERGAALHSLREKQFFSASQSASLFGANLVSISERVIAQASTAEANVLAVQESVAMAIRTASLPAAFVPAVGIPLSALAVTTAGLIDADTNNTRAEYGSLRRSEAATLFQERAGQALFEGSLTLALGSIATKVTPTLAGSVNQGLTRAGVSSAFSRPATAALTNGTLSAGMNYAFRTGYEAFTGQADPHKASSAAAVFIVGGGIAGIAADPGINTLAKVALSAGTVASVSAVQAQREGTPFSIALQGNMTEALFAAMGPNHFAEHQPASGSPPSRTVTERVRNAFSFDNLRFRPQLAGAGGAPVEAIAWRANSLKSRPMQMAGENSSAPGGSDGRSSYAVIDPHSVPENAHSVAYHNGVGGFTYTNMDDSALRGQLRDFFNAEGTTANFIDTAGQPYHQRERELQNSFTTDPTQAFSENPGIETVVLYNRNKNQSVTLSRTADGHTVTLKNITAQEDSVIGSSQVRVAKYGNIRAQSSNGSAIDPLQVKGVIEDPHAVFQRNPSLESVEVTRNGTTVTFTRATTADGVKTIEVKRTTTGQTESLGGHLPGGKRPENWFDADSQMTVSAPGHSVNSQGDATPLSAEKVVQIVGDPERALYPRGEGAAPKALILERPDGLTIELRPDSHPDGVEGLQIKVTQSGQTETRTYKRGEPLPENFAALDGPRASPSQDTVVAFNAEGKRVEPPNQTIDYRRNPDSLYQLVGGSKEVNFYEPSGTRSQIKATTVDGVEGLEIKVTQSGRTETRTYKRGEPLPENFAALDGTRANPSQDTVVVFNAQGKRVEPPNGTIDYRRNPDSLYELVEGSKEVNIYERSGAHSQIKATTVDGVEGLEIKVTQPSGQTDTRTFKRGEPLPKSFAALDGPRANPSQDTVVAFNAQGKRVEPSNQTIDYKQNPDSLYKLASVSKEVNLYEPNGAQHRISKTTVDGVEGIEVVTKQNGSETTQAYVRGESPWKKDKVIAFTLDGKRVSTNVAPNQLQSAIYDPKTPLKQVIINNGPDRTIAKRVPGTADTPEGIEVTRPGDNGPVTTRYRRGEATSSADKSEPVAAFDNSGNWVEVNPNTARHNPSQLPDKVDRYFLRDTENPANTGIEVEVKRTEGSGFSLTKRAADGAVVATRDYNQNEFLPRDVFRFDENRSVVTVSVTKETGLLRWKKTNTTTGENPNIEAAVIRDPYKALKDNKAKKIELQLPDGSRVKFELGDKKTYTRTVRGKDGSVKISDTFNKGQKPNDIWEKQPEPAVQPSGDKLEKAQVTQGDEKRGLINRTLTLPFRYPKVSLSIGLGYASFELINYYLDRFLYQKKQPEGVLTKGLNVFEQKDKSKWIQKNYYLPAFGLISRVEKEFIPSLGDDTDNTSGGGGDRTSPKPLTPENTIAIPGGAPASNSRRAASQRASSGDTEGPSAATAPPAAASPKNKEKNSAKDRDY